jgi:hypothetical protein
LVVKSEGRRPLGISAIRWEDNIKMELREIGRDGVHWIHLAENNDQRRAFVKTVLTFWFLQRRGGGIS